MYGFVGQPFLKQLYIFNEMQPETKENPYWIGVIFTKHKGKPNFFAVSFLLLQCI